MPDQSAKARVAKPADDDDLVDEGPLLSGYGIASAVLGVLCVAALALIAVLWTDHRGYEDDLRHRAQVAQTAVEWTQLLINLNPDNVDSSLRQLHERTAGELSDDFDTTLAPFRDVVQRLRSRTTGQVLSASVESIHNELGQKPRPTSAPPPFAGRTDTVLIVATSRSENASGDRPKTVSWNLRIAVSEVDDKLLVSRLEMLT